MITKCVTDLVSIMFLNASFVSHRFIYLESTKQCCRNYPEITKGGLLL